jgi:hypothetical protein
LHLCENRDSAKYISRKGAKEDEKAQSKPEDHNDP